MQEQGICGECSQTGWSTRWWCQVDIFRLVALEAMHHQFWRGGTRVARQHVVSHRHGRGADRRAALGDLWGPTGLAILHQLEHAADLSYRLAVEVGRNALQKGRKDLRMGRPVSPMLETLATFSAVMSASESGVSAGKRQASAS